MTGENLQRTSYRDPNTTNDQVRSGTPTLAENERDMDQYYRPLERIHASCLHGWGVANGLGVTVTLNSANPNLTILPGVALDSSGEHISLAPPPPSNPAVPCYAEVGPNPTGLSRDATLVPVTASGVVMPTTNLTGDKYLTIQFWETFDSTSYNNLGLFIYWHTPWLQLVDVSSFTNDGKRVVLAKVSFAASPNAGQVTALTQELRQATDLPVGSVHLQRSLATSPSAGVEAITSVEAGIIRAYTTGGLDITVPNADDEIHLERDDGTNFAKVSLGAERIVARQGNGTEKVVIDTEAGSVTASTVTAGASGTNGEVIVNDANNNQTIVLNGGIATLEVGTKGHYGAIQVLDSSGQAVCSLDGSAGTVGFNGDIKFLGNIYGKHGDATKAQVVPMFAQNTTNVQSVTVPYKQQVFAFVVLTSLNLLAAQPDAAGFATIASIDGQPPSSRPAGDPMNMTWSGEAQTITFNLVARNTQAWALGVVFPINSTPAIRPPGGPISI